MTQPVMGAFALTVPIRPPWRRSTRASWVSNRASPATGRALKVQGIWVTMHRVDGYQAPPWPDAASHAHLDFAVTNDLDTAEARAIELGATKASTQPNPDGWRVLLDPAGHPFCLGPASSYP